MIVQQLILSQLRDFKAGMEGALDLEVWVEEQGRLLALEREAEIAEVRGG